MAEVKTIESSEEFDDLVPKKEVRGAQTSESAPKDDGKKRGPIGQLILFIKQIIAEIKKVTTPTPTELKEYVIVVLVFVVVIMLFITAVDFGIGKGVMALFAK